MKSSIRSISNMVSFATWTEDNKNARDIHDYFSSQCILAVTWPSSEKFHCRIRDILAISLKSGLITNGFWHYGHMSETTPSHK